MNKPHFSIRNPRPETFEVIDDREKPAYPKFLSPVCVCHSEERADFVVTALNYFYDEIRNGVDKLREESEKRK